MLLRAGEAQEELDDVQVSKGQPSQWKSGQMLQALPEGFHVVVDGDVLVVQAEHLRRRFVEGSSVLVYQNGWVKATVLEAFIEENLLHRSDRREHRIQVGI